MLRHTLFFGAMLLLPAVSLAQPAPPANAPRSDQRNDDIIVTARSLADTARDLADCIARRCPPNEDMAATLAHAENQFVSGNYADARLTLNRSLDRNRRARNAFPVAVSGLYRAFARVSAHLGEGDAYYRATLDMRDTLARAFPASDGRVLAARIEVADSRVRLGQIDTARSMYADVATDAARAGNKRVAAFALIRLAVANYPPIAAERNPVRVRRSVADLQTISADATAVGADMALLADVLLARIERDRGDFSRTNALAQRFATSGARRPLLLSGDPIDLNDLGIPNDDANGSTLRRQQMADVARRWIDVGFWINRSGTVSDFEVLRHEGDPAWAAAVARSINSRRYAALRTGADVDTPGFYIIERYTLTADWTDNCTGSRQRCRDTRLRIERLDLTPDSAPAAG